MKRRSASQPDILLDGLGAPESLRWHEGALWFSDMGFGGVHRLREAGSAELVVDVPGRAGGLGWTTTGELLVVSSEGRQVLRLDQAGDLRVHADLSDLAGGPANDMYVDPQGRAYVGNFGFDYHAFHREHSNSALYAPPGVPTASVACLAPDGSLLGLSDPLMFPNGIVAMPSPNGGRGTVVVAETMAMRLTEFDVDERGVLVNPRLWAPLIPDLLWSLLTRPGIVGSAARRVSAAADKPAIARHSSSPLAPDGIAVHHDGETIWIANALRGECARIARGGRVVQRVMTAPSPVPGREALCCVLGGGDGRTLFIATVTVNDPPRARALRTGRIEAIAV